MLPLLSFLFFTGLVAFISWRLTHRDDHSSKSGYFLGGRSLTWVVIAGSLLLTNLSTEQLVGLNSGGYQHGMQVAAWEIFAAVAMIVMALVFLPRYLRGGVTTVSEFLASRYDKSTGIIISVLLLLSLLTNLLPFVLYSGALFMVKVFHVAEIFNVNENSALWLTTIALGVVGSIYAIFGGLKAVAVSDTLNGIGLFTGGLLIPFFALHQLGDGSIAAGFTTLTETRPELLNPIGKSDDNLPLGTLFTGVLLLHLYYWCTNQAIVQRTFGSLSLAQGQKGLLFAAAMKLLGPFYLVLPGIIAFHLFGGSLENPDDAYATLIQTVLPKWMLGFFGAVIFGAILSSFNSGLNSASTLFSVDLYKGIFRPEASEGDMVKVGKTFGIIAAIAAIGVAPFIGTFSGGLFDLMKSLAALYNIPLLAITLGGIFMPRIPPMAAKISLFGGFAFYGWFGIHMRIADSNNCDVFGHPIHWLHVAGINFALLILFMIIYTAIKPRKTAWVQTDVKAVDLTPWRGARIASVAVLICIVLIYAVLSQFG
ncbi:MAG: solute:sodium symporter family transporter [Verrucomicrobiales bacterium]|nr:solute:sodium symporter family transporter [Verrucomicrobiales bacterium]